MAVMVTQQIPEYGIELAGVYVRIVNMEFSVPSNKYVNLGINEYLTKAKRDEGVLLKSWKVSMPVESFGTDTLFTWDALLDKAYKWLHTLEQYSKVKDC